MDIICKKKCKVCNEKIEKIKSGIGRYKHYFYLLHNRSYRLVYGNYSNSIHPDSAEYVMVCHKCLGEKEITIPGYIPEEQYKDYLIGKLENK